MSFIDWLFGKNKPRIGQRPPEHPPGWRNIKPAKKRANNASTRRGGTVAKKRTGK